MSGTSSRGNPRMSDVIRSVVVLGVVMVGIWWLASVLFTVTPERPIEGEDLQQSVQTSRPAVTAFDLLAPERLPEGWLLSSVRPQAEAWDLNVLTAEDRYVGLQQAVSTEADLVAGRDASFEETGTAEVAGQEWTVWEAPGQVAFTRTDGDVATLVLGDAPREDVEAFMGLLSPDAFAVSS